MPTLVFVILFLFTWEALLPVMLISLFFDIRYGFKGNKNTNNANSVLNKAGNFANHIKHEFIENTAN